MAETTKVLIHPLNGHNFATWKVQCKMALIEDRLWNIVTGTEAEPEGENDRPKYWLRKDRALATIVLAVEPSLLYLLGPDPDDPAVIWKKLADQFQKKTWSNKLALRRKLYGLKLKEGQPIQKHVKSMTEVFDELATIGDPLDDEDRVIHLLASLPKSYDMLVTALEALPEVPEIEVVTERLLHEERKQKDTDSKVEVKAMTSIHRYNGKGPKCHHCGKYGHMKRECRELLRDSGRIQSQFKKEWPTKQKAYAVKEELRYSQKDDEGMIGLVAEQVLATKNISNWIVDSGATCHMCNDKSLLTDIEDIEETQDITLGDGYAVNATAKGTVELNMYLTIGKSQRCRLHDVLYVPNLSYNLLSVAKGTSSGKSFKFADSNCSILDGNGRQIATATKSGNLYHLNCSTTQTANAIVKKCASSEETKENLWHRRFGHLGAGNLEKLARRELVSGFDYDTSKKPEFCEPCIDGKHHRLPFPKKGGERAEDILQLVHSDVCGKIEVKSLSGAEYFVTFIDDKSRCVWVYVLKHKSEVLEKFTEWKTIVEKSSGKKLVKVLRSDNGGEYKSNDFDDLLKKNGIKHETTVPKTPEQNGVAERMNRPLVETTRSMFADSGLPKRFWAEALSTAVYLHNRSPTTSLQSKTPFEAWFGHKPDVNHLRVFGCDAYAHVPKDERRKIDSKAKKAIFLGYGDGIKGYRLYDTEKQRVFYSRDVIFNEIKFSPNTTDLSEEDKKETFVEIEVNNNNEDIEPIVQEEQNQQPRERRPPNRYGEWVYLAHESENPKSVKEALSSPEKDEWVEAMEREMESLHENEVWNLVELPDGRKSVGCKWVFKKKHDADGNVERFKARLVAQGYNQKSGVDYDETFSPVLRFESVRTMIALAVEQNLELHQIDVTTAFLNGELMKQPEGFLTKGKENLVCELKRSIYGLKQSPRCWNEAVDKFLKELDFTQSLNDPCIYINNSGGEVLIVAVYVDDIILAGKSSTRIQEFIQKIAEKFKIKDMGKLHHFLGVKIVYLRKKKIWIGQQTYSIEILKKFQMENSKPVSTPTEPGTKLIKASKESQLVDQETYQSAVGSLLYLSTRTRPDIAYAVSSVARYCSQPTLQHWIAVKRIFRYLNGTLDYGLIYEPSDKAMCGYSDADWAGDCDDRKSTTGYVFKMS